MSTFEPAEHAARVSAARAELKNRGLAALLIFAQESQYYLFGYDGGGYVYFQCSILTADEAPVTLLCRRPDRDQARDTSTIDDVRIWLNAEDANPAADVREILREKGLSGERIGIEMDNFGLNGFNYQLMVDAVDGFCTLEDASSLVRSLRVVKSDAEMALIRKAGDLADDAVEAISAAAAPGIVDAKLAAVCLETMLVGGGDVPPAGPLVNSGSRAIYGRGVGGPRPLDANDQVMVEFAATYQRYNCCIERFIAIGKPDPGHLDMYKTVEETMHNMLAEFRPGNELGKVDDAHRQTLDAAGYRENRFEACGYSLGATYRPSWMDVPPMIYSGNPLELKPGMVFFPHVMLGDKETRLAMGLGVTVVITDTGCEMLSRLPLEMIVKD